MNDFTPALTLQRASAGSGKTYTLTKVFLRMFLSIKKKEGSTERRLRNRYELADSLRHILAITFTNKATSEMKQRIVKALDNLAGGSPDTDYMQDFCRELHASPEDVAKCARSGLELLLNSYSDFQVSTIDSFFQTVLRTFAYESHLNDTYGLELDTDFLNESALEALMEQIDNTPSSVVRGGNRQNTGKEVHSTDEVFWIRQLMDRRQDSRAWNVFQKGAFSIYRDIKNALKYLEKEEFKELREKLDEYWEKGTAKKDFEKAELYFSELESKAVQEIKDMAAELIEAAEPVRQYCNSKVLSSTVANIAGGAFDTKSKATTIVKGGERTKKANASLVPLFDQLDSRMGLLMETLRAYLENRNLNLWRLYRELYPMLGTIQTVRKYISDALDEQNLILLSETNSLLRRIIGKDDIPFVYEKLGGKLNHLLIDEFQDTSLLQWENLRPLLDSPLAESHESLLIGDAKQSIYRFRNADPSIILEHVPDHFSRNGLGVDIKGDSESENTNWRSDQRIVEFNNHIFGAVAEALEIPYIRAVYGNVSQAVAKKHRNGRGYVELTTFRRDADGEEGKYPAYFSTFGPMVEEMLNRGYRQKDIAFLVTKNDVGLQVVQALMDYNSSRQPGERRIEFISDTSLQLKASTAVNIIVTCLESIASGTTPRDREKEKENGDRRADWYEIRTALQFFILTHPDMPPHRQITEFLSRPQTGDSLDMVVKGMQSVALPALVEAVAANFVSPEMRASDAPFIAAMQDAVLEFCAVYAADLSSFLDWWKTKGQFRSISSPEGADAVQVMTIHKSKGLEFGCVIIPEAAWGTTEKSIDSKKEWKWVVPAIEMPEGFTLPPLMPVNLQKTKLKDTPHEDDYRLFYRNAVMDNMNSAYVALTRAVHELYIFAPMSKKEEGGVHTLMVKKCREWEEIERNTPDAEASETEEDNGNGKTEIFRFGSPLSAEAIRELKQKEEEDKRKKEKESGSHSREAKEGYEVNSSPDFLRYKESALPSPAVGNVAPEPDDDPAEETDPDPRSEGNLMHEAMQYIKVEADLPKALLRLKTAGLLDTAGHASIAKALRKALDDASVFGWFSGEWKVLTERPILFRNSSTRPDRVMLSPDGKRAVVIDYKFGRKVIDEESGELRPDIFRRHSRQVDGYVRKLMATGRFKLVEGFVWYVPFGRMEKVRP